VDKAELSEICGRVLKSKDGDARVVALALQRFLLHEGRRKVFDKRAYQREYMARYRRGEVGGKRRGRRKKR